MRICDRCKSADHVQPTRVELATTERSLAVETIDLCEECRAETREQIKAIFAPVSAARTRRYLEDALGAAAAVLTECMAAFHWRARANSKRPLDLLSERDWRELSTKVDGVVRRAEVGGDLAFVEGT